MNDLNLSTVTVELKAYDAPTILLVETDPLDCITYSEGDTPRVFWDW